MKNLVIILDPAHGKNVPGKRSPDGLHREYLWSRERCHSIKALLAQLGYEVFLTTESEDEPGLSKRKNFASQLQRPRKLFVSLHNNARGMGDKWYESSGASVWTSKGVTQSDVCANYVIEKFQEDFKDIPIRKYAIKEGEKDFEENFTVLMGTYMAILVEWLFQDCKTDVEKLQNPQINGRFDASIVGAIEKINTHFEE